ncbi:MAG TPA: HlyD family efflux transporter periplasmic adaptor subunit, partial [Longimicrobium sp.]|nr:HlyD family efflux transporter periplasmic adaptor subunit [Longimicrobium sp.]
LAQQNMVSAQELARARDNAADLRTRVEVERRRLEYMRQSMRQQIASQESQVVMLRRLAEFNQSQIASMKVKVVTDGVLQELPVEMGQWVNSGATLAKVVQPGRLKAVLRIPETQARDVTVGQAASIDTRNGIIPGRVVRIDPAAQNGTVDIERLKDVLYVGRPAYGDAESTVGLFRVEPGRREAARVAVRLGRASASTIEVLQGLQPGDVVILSDMSQYDKTDRLKLQ